MKKSEPGQRRPPRPKYRSKNAVQTPEQSAHEGERIAKRLARAGICSRREAEKLIGEGRVKVDGKVLTSPALNVTDKSKIEVDGETLAGTEETRLWRYHKPAGTLTTNKDPEGRPTVFEKLPPEMPRTVSVGRLDFNTEGLLLLTNDGELARHLELPKNAWLRHYRVRVHGAPIKRRLAELAEGAVIDGVVYEPMNIEFEDDSNKPAPLNKNDGRQSENPSNRWVRIVIREGKNREIRKAMEYAGFDVTRLLRTAFGPFPLGKLPRGAIEEVPRRVLHESLGNFFTGHKAEAKKVRQDKK